MSTVKMTKYRWYDGSNTIIHFKHQADSVTVLLIFHLFP